MPGSSSWSFAAQGFACVSIALLLWIVVARRLCKWPRSRAISGNVALLVFPTAYTLLIIELAFSVFVLESHGLGYVSLASQRWAAKYWFPTINSYGYRDYEPVWSDHALFVIGSSFAAGGGIEHLEDRMSAVLGRKLGPHWTVATLAGPGWPTGTKYDHLLAFPKTPDVLLVSDFAYDIDNAAAKHGLKRPEVAIGPHGFFKPLVDRSSLVNWIYWRYAKEGAPGEYWAYLQRAFADPQIFADYLEGLGKFMDYARKNGARLYFVIWPFATYLDDNTITPKVSAALKERGANVIDLTPHLKNRPLRDLVVNSSDSHPNARIHAEMAEAIFQRLSKDGLEKWADVRKQ